MTDLTNEVFGMLTLVRFVEKNKHGQAKWFCRCECGKEKIIAGYHLTQGKIKSCGCLRSIVGKQTKTTHGKSGTRAHTSWMKMRQRCTDSNCTGYENYGGRGIKVDPAFDTFEGFLQHIGECPAGYSLDRIDYNGDYAPGNVRWADRKTQNRNRQTNVIVEYKGERKTVSEWAEVIGLDFSTLYQRLFTYHWDIERSLTTSADNKRGPNKETEASPEVKAQRKLHVAVRTGQIVSSPICQHPGCTETEVRSHHHRGYDEKNWLDVVWLCQKHRPYAHEISITYKGETKTLREWSQETGIKPATIRDRLKKNNGIVDETTFAPTQSPSRMLTLNGETGNIRYWSKKIGVSKNAISNRLKRGLPIE